MWCRDNLLWGAKALVSYAAYRGSTKHVFAVCIYVDLCAGGAAVSSDGYGYNEKEQEEEERKKEGKIEGRKGRLKETKAKRQIQPDREVVSVYQEHTDLAASSLSVVVPSSSLLQHLPERHQAEQDPNPSTAPSQDHSLINLVLLQAQLSSSPFHIPYLFVFTPSHVSNPKSGPPGLYLFFTCSLNFSSLQLPSLIFQNCKNHP
ncbi:hypothetical protein Q8A73_020292 [Channa argus]|nr:hypothetical protein Q8A73_020292 [Channa argus]